MQKIQVLIGELFADSKRSIEDLTAGFDNHNTLFQVAPDKKGLLKVNQVRSQTLLGQLNGLTSAVGSGQATQQAGRTLTQDDRQKALDRLSANEAALRSDYLVEDAKLRQRLLQLLFPNGLTAFGTAPLKALPDLLRVFLDLVQDPKNGVPDIFVERTVADLSPFANTRDTQITQIQATELARAERRGLLPAIQEQLTRNLHALCFLFEEDRSQVASYFSTRYFEDQAVSRPGRHAGSVAPGKTNQVVNLATAAARYTTLSLRVDEPRPLNFYCTDDPKMPHTGNSLVVTQASPLTVLLADVPGTGALLVVCNPGGAVGHYVAELLVAAG